MKTVLLDICCSNCATVCIERLRSEGYGVAGCFINDNIQPEEEYCLRRASVEKLAVYYGITVFYEEYQPENWLEYIKGLEHEPEKGARCDKCFEYRFAKVFSLMREKGCDYFTTTLTISPYKQSKKINAIGSMIGEASFMPLDFKKNDGYKVSLERSRELDLYRQRYCGCMFSDRRKPESIHVQLQRRLKDEWLYYSFNQFLQEKYGTVVYRLSLSSGLDCPNLDGTVSDRGCIFCDNQSFSTFADKESVYDLETQIIRLQESLKERFKAEKFIAYFQSYSSTHAPVEELKKIYDVILPHENIVGLCVSTRPDCVDDDKLDLLASYNDRYDVYIEYGLQSIHDRTLDKINRGHDYDTFKKAVFMAGERGLYVGAHVILGLPGENAHSMRQTARELSNLPLWGVKIHALHVIKSTQLAQMYYDKEIDLLSEDDYVDLVIDFLRHLPEQFVILRMVSDANRNYLIAPEWISNKQQTIRKIEWKMLQQGHKQGDLC